MEKKGITEQLGEIVGEELMVVNEKAQRAVVVPEIMQ